MSSNFFKLLRTGIDCVEYVINENNNDVSEETAEKLEQENKLSEEIQTKILREQQSNDGMTLLDKTIVVPGELIFVERKLTQKDKEKLSEMFNIDKFPVSLRKYRHFGVYAGNNEIIHYAPVRGRIAMQKKVSREEFEKGILSDILHDNWSPIKLDVAPMNNPFCDNDDELREYTLRQAKMFLGMFEVIEKCDKLTEISGQEEYTPPIQEEYDPENFDPTQAFHILYNNSEHFARWCACNEKISLQVEGKEACWTEGKKLLFNKIEFIGQFIRKYEDNENYLDDWLASIIS